MNNTENIKAYYDMLIDAGNDPVRDSPLMKQYMDRWDGEGFRNSLLLNPSFGNYGRYRTYLSKKTLEEPCPRCGAPIHKASYLGGNIHFCSRRQRL